MICKHKSTKLNSSIKYQTFVYMQLNDQTVPFQTKVKVKWSQILLCITNNSIKCHLSTNSSILNNSI